ncbi:EmrB/QacA subfamily drug resistance transporter [Paenibacillus taihuensis]|uniref:EmrB/QacA subfamily drug resistance transporter n=1 Tax=Paenibacillus taihuensis TaxID=1156355 RepID=A0A3D9SFD4_9BACL|nr:MFS transporter [Paenibacillus taihuensis]REE94638.1 EmrB/QacA subfamily drug resistance transporter [Paenibacillus taihuensis]
MNEHSKRMILTMIIACQLMMVLDASVLVTAMPEIGRSLHLSTAALTWVQNAYILAFGGFLLLGARAGDILGRRKTFSAGIALFTLASMLAGLAPSSTLLLAARALQGLAAAMATPSALALLSVSFSEARERSKAIAIYSAVSGAGGSVGLIIGGLLTDLISWRAGMFLNVPIGIALLLIVPRYMQETEMKAGRLDILGALTSVIGMTALAFGFVQAASVGWGAPEVWGSLAVGGVSLAAFVWIEARAKEPITPLRLFASRTRSGAYLGRLLLLCGNYPIFFFIPQYLQNVLHFDSLEAGLAIMPFTVVQFGMMYAMPSLVTRFGNVKVLIAGLGIAIAGTSWLSQISADSSFFPELFFPLIVMGGGAGLIFQPFTTLGLSGVDAKDAGAASGLVNVAHQTGASLGLAVLIAVFEAANQQANPSTATFAHAISISIWGSVMFLTASLVAVLIFLIPRARATSRQGMKPRQITLRDQ